MEWLYALTRNQVGFAHTGLNPAVFPAGIQVLPGGRWGMCIS